ncbi:phosphoglycerate mutase family protein [Ancylostoma ceylanicum]|uniref:Phosphoglycerate mutase family protein n=1 Tax=Ancylostoma ceylanicum TaxID=53326 RepID=A0A0D6LCY5_9BILA|nr:phosphoglycerate mutase family protein [Ancylostoma ceylanicum]
MTCSYWPRATGKKQAGRMIVIMRSAERVDRIFGPDWIHTEAPNGYLTPTDLNIPHNTAAKKLLYGKAYEDNPPITAFGKYCAQLSARALCNRGIQPELVVCSPTLRSIQTGDALARFLKTKIAIEPGLLEPLSWYRSGDKPLPEFHLDLLTKLYPIDESYSPVMNMDTIHKLYDKETEAQGVSRADFVLRSLSAFPQGEHKATSASSGSATAITSFDWHMSVDMLEGEVVDQVNLGIRFPPGSIVALTQVNKGPPYLYQLSPNIVPPLSYGEFYSNRPVLQT